MAVIKKANTNARMVALDFVFDPQWGLQRVETWQGMEAAIETVAAQAASTGFARCRTYQFQGPVYRTEITYGADTAGTEAPYDTWERVTEYIQEPLESNPKVVAAAGGTATLSQWLKDIKAAVSAGTGLSGTPSANEQALYDEYAMGTRAWERKRFVLRRRRTISLTHAAVAVANSVENIYTTLGLKNTFGVPIQIYSKLPASGDAAPPGRVWAWKERADNSQFTPVLNKSEEVKDWVFAPWSTLLYTLVS